MGILSVKQYKDAISNALSPRQIETLQILYHFPNSSATAKQLASALNYSGFQAANRQVGQIGRTIAHHLDILQPLWKKQRQRRAYYYLVGDYNDHGWNMWEELRKHWKI